MLLTQLNTTILQTIELHIDQDNVYAKEINHNTIC